MKPGDLVKLKQSTGFATLYQFTGPASLSAGASETNPETGRMVAGAVALVLALDTCPVIGFTEEALVLCGEVYGWREVECFEVVS